MTIASDDFFDLVVHEDPWGGHARTTEEIDVDLLNAFGKASDPRHADTDVALALLDLVRDDLTLSGTGKDARVPDAQMRLAIRTLNKVMARAGYEFALPFRDHASWREWWIRQGARNSYQARRDLLHDLFDPAIQALERHAAALPRTPAAAGGTTAPDGTKPPVRAADSGAAQPVYHITNEFHGVAPNVLVQGQTVYLADPDEH